MLSTNDQPIVAHTLDRPAHVSVAVRGNRDTYLASTADRPLSLLSIFPLSTDEYCQCTSRAHFQTSLCLSSSSSRPSGNGQASKQQHAHSKVTHTHI